MLIIHQSAFQIVSEHQWVDCWQDDDIGLTFKCGFLKYKFSKSSEKQNIRRRKKPEARIVMSTPFILQGENQGPERLVAWARPQGGLAASQGQSAGLFFWPASRSLGRVVSSACLLGWFTGEGILTVWAFRRSRWAIWGQRARALFDTAASPSCTILFPWWRNCRRLLLIAEVLEGMKINKAWQLCSRVMTCSPPCHFQLSSSLSGCHVIWVSATFRNHAAGGMAMQLAHAGPSSLNSRLEAAQELRPLFGSLLISKCSPPSP